MYDNENVNWFSQVLLTFKDKQFSTDGYLKLSISTNTNDYKFFNPPLFNISISTNIQKSYNLNIQQAEDLLESFTQVLKQVNGSEIVVEKSYHKTSNIYFKFTIDNVNQIRVVVIEIVSNDSDITKVIVPLKPTFQSFVRRLKSYVENYDNICFNLLSKSIDSNSTQIISRLPSLIKGVSSQIVSQIPEQEFVQDSGAPEIPQEDVEKTSMTIEDLDKFMGEDMKNIDIPELKEIKVEKKQAFEVRSEFVETFLNNNLHNLEVKLISFAISKQPILDLVSDIESSLNLNLFENINEDDKKSLVYVSTLLQKYFFKSYTINDTPLPSSNIILKFEGEKTEKKVEFAKDLITFITFMSVVRSRLESKIQSAYDNKALVYLYLRSFLDPFCFSFINDLNKNELVNIVKNRYTYFEGNGVFDEYKKLLEEQGCKPVTVEELMGIAEKAFSEMNKPFIKEAHDYFYSKGEMKLASKNNLNLEQIINEFIPVEVDYKLGFDFENKEEVVRYQEQHKISDDIIKYFTKKSKPKTTTTMERITPLQKWVDKYKQDIPEQYRDSFIEYIKELKFNKYDFSEIKFPLVEFDENIVKALYAWNPEIDSEMKTNFTHFASLVQNEQMDKESILVSISQATSENASDWDNINL